MVSSSKSRRLRIGSVISGYRFFAPSYVRWRRKSSSVAKFCRDVELGQQYITLQCIRLDLVEYLADGYDCFRQTAENGFHFFLRLQVVFRVGKSIACTPPVTDGSGLELTFFYTQQYVVGIGLFFIQVIRSAGGEISHAILFPQIAAVFRLRDLLRECRGGSARYRSLRQTACATTGRLLGLAFAYVQYKIRDLAGQAPGYGNKVCFILLNQRLCLYAGVCRKDLL